MISWYKIAQTELEENELEDIARSKWVNVDSSFIQSVAYYGPLQLFEIKFKNGKIYTFRDVPQSVYDAFMASDSKGKFFSTVIRKQYTGERKIN